MPVILDLSKINDHDEFYLVLMNSLPQKNYVLTQHQCSMPNSKAIMDDLRTSLMAMVAAILDFS